MWESGSAAKYGSMWISTGIYGVWTSGKVWAQQWGTVSIKMRGKEQVSLRGKARSWIRASRLFGDGSGCWLSPLQDPQWQLILDPQYVDYPRIAPLLCSEPQDTSVSAAPSRATGPQYHGFQNPFVCLLDLSGQAGRIGQSYRDCFNIVFGDLWCLLLKYVKYGPELVGDAPRALADTSGSFLQKSFFRQTNDKHHGNAHRPEHLILRNYKNKKRRTSPRLEFSRSDELPIFHMEPICEKTLVLINISIVRVTLNNTIVRVVIKTSTCDGSGGHRRFFVGPKVISKSWNVWSW